MAIAHKQTLATGQGAATNPWTVNNISGPVAGDVAVMLAATDSTHTINTGSLPSGWTFVATIDDASADTSSSLLYKVYGGSEPSTYSLTFGANEAGIAAISCWTGVNNTTPMDVTATSASSGSTTAKDTPNITPVTPGAMLLGVIAADPGAARSFTWDAGIDPRLDQAEGTVGYLAIGSRLWDLAANDSLGGDLNTADTATLWSIALRPGGRVPRYGVVNYQDPGVF